ncbi:hypothetical protein LINGRAHAP2_LOCUS27902 [Linum grandiflorum]
MIIIMFGVGLSTLRSESRISCHSSMDLLSNLLPMTYPSLLGTDATLWFSTGF